MSGLSLVGRSQMLAAFLAPDLFSAPDYLYLCLTRTIPGPAMPADALDEPEDPAYVRQAYPRAGGWARTGTGELCNALEVFFPVPTQDWGLIEGWALATASAGGDVWLYGELVTPARVIASGPDAVVHVGYGALVVTQR